MKNQSGYCRRQKGEQAGPGITVLYRSLRFIGYGLMGVALTEFMRWDAGHWHGDALFSENSYTEFAQEGLLGIASVLLYWLYRTSRVYRYTALALLGLTMVSLLRELDVYFEAGFGNGTWQYPVYAVLLCVGVILYRNRFRFLAEINRFTLTPAFGFFTAGFLTTYVFSRMMGRKIFWYVVMKDRYFRAVKNTVEESLELYGYLLLFIAVIELILSVIRAQRLPENDNSRPDRTLSERGYISG